MIEQIRYERSDGAPMATRVVVTDTAHFNEVRNELMVEDTVDQATEFSYNDFLCMLHKRIRAKALE